MTRKRFVITVGRILITMAIAIAAVPGSWAFQSITEYEFQGVPDGSQPGGGLVSDGAGNFYGTTEGGGFSVCGLSAPFCGTVFKLSIGEDGVWKETVIHKFRGGADGAAPEGALIFDAAGNLYGTTVTGGNDLCVEGCGTVYKLSPNPDGTWKETVLHRFLGGNDAEQPGSGVVFDPAGNLYGSAGGGCQFGCNGTIFRLAPNPDGKWKESVLYTFEGGLDGGFPSALVVDGAGNIFGTTFSKLHVINTGPVSYLAFLAPGIIAQSALFISIFYGIQIIWDRDAGILAKLMVTPAPASALISGKAFAAGVRSVAQVVGVLALAYVMGIGMTINPLRILAAMAVVMLGSAFFACLSMTLAGLVRSRDRLMGIGQAITMPLFFASNALYPVDVMPSWLHVLSTVNPLSYEVHALRALLIGTPFNPWDVVVLVVAAIIGIATASTLLRRLVR